MPSLRFAASVLAAIAPLHPTPTGPSPPSIVAAQDEVVPEKVRRRLIATLPDVARLGDATLLDELRDIAHSLGADENEIRKWDRKTTRALERAATPSAHRTRSAVTKRLRKAAEALEDELDRNSDEALAQALLRLDSESDRAREALGHVRHHGRWLDTTQLAHARGTRAIETAVQEAEKLTIETEWAKPSTHPLVQSFYGDESHVIHAHGIEVHGGLDEFRLERALERALHALAFVHWTLHGKVAIPAREAPVRIGFAKDDPDFDALLDRALEVGLIPPIRHAEHRTQRFGSFVATDGSRISRWRTEADVASLIVWCALDDVLPADTPLTLFAGLDHWVSLRFLGTGKPSAALRLTPEQAGGSVAPGKIPTAALWRAARGGTFGARCWILSQLESGVPITFARSLVQQEGKLQGESLLVATLATEYLLVADRFRGAVSKEWPIDATPTAAMEHALAQRIPEFDDEWTSWLLGRSQPAGLLQTIEGTTGSAAATGPSPQETALIERLLAVRHEAFAHLKIPTETPVLFGELSQRAKLHAAYLVLHPDLHSVWPDVHEEDPDRQGYSPEGVWAGGHSVIDFDPDPGRSLDRWVHTFYHRLPLLDPGLCGVGLAIDDGVTVLDTGSLVAPFYGDALIAWPADGADDVPLSFQPELPNPVPGEDQSTFGYAFSVQTYRTDELGTRNLELAMFERDGRKPVECHFLSPTVRHSPHLAPPNAFCLIPKAHLQPRTNYVVEGSCPETDDTWTWRFRTGR